MARKPRFSGKSIQYYLNNLPMCKLREFIQQKNKNFLLVAPTLNDRTGGGPDGPPGDALWIRATPRRTCNRP